MGADLWPRQDHKRAASGRHDHTTTGTQKKTTLIQIWQEFEDLEGTQRFFPVMVRRVEKDNLLAPLQHSPREEGAQLLKGNYKASRDSGLPQWA